MNDEYVVLLFLFFLITWLVHAVSIRYLIHPMLGMFLSWYTIAERETFGSMLPVGLTDGFLFIAVSVFVFMYSLLKFGKGINAMVEERTGSSLRSNVVSKFRRY